MDESGLIFYRDVAIGGRDLLSFDRAGPSVVLAGDSNASFGLGVATVTLSVRTDRSNVERVKY